MLILMKMWGFMNKIFLKFSFFIFIFSFISNYNIYSQDEEIKFYYYGVEHGLPESSVNSIIQDKKGFLWIGTMRGLCRFDGYNFKNMVTNPNEKVNNIFIDRTNILWIGTEKGLIKYDEKYNRIRRYTADFSKEDSLYSNSVLKFVEDRYNNIWILTDKGINIYNSEKDNFYRIKLKSNYIGRLLKAFYIDSKGNIWIGSDGGGLSVIRYEDIKKFSTTKKVEDINIFNYKEDAKSIKFVSNEISSIIENKAGNIFLGTINNGLMYVNRDELISIITDKKRKIKINSITANYKSKEGLNTNRIYCLYEDSKNNLWIGTYGAGLIKYLGNNKFVSYRSNDLYKNTISNDYVISIYEDAAGLLWIGTGGGGLNKCNANKINFKSIKKSYTNSELGLKENMIFSILEDKEKNIWIGTRNGLSFYNYKLNRFFHYTDDDNYPVGIKNNIVRTICEDSSGNIWIGSVSNGLFKYDKRTKSFLNYTRDEKSINTISYNNIRSLLVDGKDYLWIGTINGLDLLNLRTGNIEHFIGTDDATSISSSYVYYIYKDKWDNIWFGTKDGLSLFDRISKKFHRFYYNKGKEVNEVVTIASGNDGKVYFGTPAKGVFCLSPAGYDKSGKPFYNSSSIVNRPFRHQLLESDFIYSMRSDQFGEIWFGTSNGLWCFNPKDSSLKKYDINDGLLSNEFNTNASFEGRDGTLYFGGINGINYFKPGIINNQNYRPKVSLTSFKIYDKEIVFDEGIENINKIELSYTDNYFTFEFSILDFADPSNNNYIYMLEGFDRDWVNAGNRRFASYTNIPGGDYIFRVKGAGKNGVWCEEEKAVKIHINPPFYKTILFQIISIIGLMLFVFLFIKYRTKKLDEQNKKLELLVKQRTDEIRKSEERYKSFVSQTTEGIWRCEFNNPIDTSLPKEKIIELFLEEGYIAECNDVMAVLFGYENASNLINLKIKDIFGFDENSIIKTFVNSNYKIVSENSLKVFPDGSKKYFTNNLIGIIENGYLVRAWGTLTDITEKVKLEEEVLKAQKLESLGILAGGLAHDFNNLLTGILGNISLAKMYTDKDSKLYKRLNEAEKASFRAKDLTLQLMTFAKGGAPIKKPVDLKKLLKDTVEFSLSGSKSKSEFNIADDLLIVECDEGQISQVISNLIINADQAMINGGKIEISASNVENAEEVNSMSNRYSKYVKISIKDYGVGIPPENLTKVFDPFFTTKPKGKGLGLSSVYSIIKRHDGFIEVDSKVGEGTTFNVFLPASTKKVEIKLDQEVSLEKFEGKILLMDDEEMIRDFASILLTEMGFEVDLVCDGSEAIEKYKESLQKNKYKAVILDLTVPGGVGGKEAARDILELDKDAIIFVSSGYSNDPIMSDYQSYGISGIIPKPYKTEELYYLLSKVLSKK
jgi:ligand-binding sensor domain-containing protein/signal transduction histidine kinase/CheY-like chemotaxis protein